MRFLGVLSGTSADGIDLGLVDFTDGISLLAFETTPFPTALQKQLHQLPGGRATLPRLSQLQAELNAAFAEAITAFLGRHGPVTAIGFHGQTLWHDPACGATWQLGDPAHLAEAARTPVISGFRHSDLALGGQGAPLAPAFHAELFARLPRPFAVVNIGGIANVSLIGERGIQGWDSGPGNGIMDELAQRHFDRPFDKDGRIAASGQVDDALLATLLQHDFFRQSPPKSTGREQFNLAWLLRHLDTEIPPEDLMATACALTAAAIAHDLAGFSPEKVILCGGGAKNSVLTAQIRQFFERFRREKNQAFKISGGPPSDVLSSDQFGVPADALEAMLFAWLAKKRWCEEPVDYTTITGARKPGLYGAIWQT